MPVRTKVEPIDRDIAVIVDELLSPEAQGQALADFALDALAEAEGQNASVLGAVPPHHTFVDGQETSSLAAARGTSTIVFEFELLDEALLYIAEQLTKHAPVRTGAYTASFVVIADGVEVPANHAFPPAREYVFSSTAPYARKIERGLSPQASDGVFEAVAALAAARFGNVARIAFGHQSLLFGAIDEWASKTRAGSATGRGRTRSQKGRGDWLRRQPAIIVTMG